MPTEFRTLLVLSITVFWSKTIRTLRQLGETRTNYASGVYNKS